MFPISSILTLKVQYLLLTFLGQSFISLHNLHYANEEGVKTYSETLSAQIQENVHAFDFIIVGSGSAGAVVANRLSEKYKVLLVEAGGSPFPLGIVPGMAGGLINHPDTDWQDKAVPQERACHAYKNNGTLLSHGKGLGGSSMLNFMLYMRGSPHDYDNWANLTGDSEWSYENLLPYFKKIETYNGQFPRGNTHGSDGLLHIETPQYAPLYHEWKAAAAELGYKIMDPNSYQSEGFFPAEFTTKNGSRDSTYSAYLEPILGRPNLKILLHSHVTRVELNENNHATGIHYILNGKEYFVKSRKEVILSAGALGSPKILMLSGIGPKEHLESLDIPVRIDLPVGQNLQDHVLSHIGPFIIDDNRTFVADRDRTSQSFVKYLQNSQGPLAGIGVGGCAVIKSSVASQEWPDILAALTPWGLHQSVAEDLQVTNDFKEGILQQYYKGYLGNDSFNIVVVLGLPRSRGEMKLSSKNPFHPPNIDPKYFSHPEDLKILLEGVQLARKIALETNSFRGIGARLIKNLFPGCEQFENTESEDYWKCFVKHWTTTMWHFSCTCRMGFGSGDKNSVVNSKLLVLGTTGLRVIDNSIMPQITNANTNLPAIVIGEKGADIILKYWEEMKNPTIN